MRVYRYAFYLAAGLPLLIAACSNKPSFVAKDEPWRDSAERSCLDRLNLANAPNLTATRQSLGGPSACGAVRPFDMRGTYSGRVRMAPAATLQCQMIPTVDRWITEVVEPAAVQHLHAQLVELKVAASYACRPMNGVSGAKLSEHGHANALDISAFILSDGRTLSVKSGWHGSAGERAFLRAVHRGGCEIFTTVLGPNANSYHADHFHLDLARHGKDGSHRVCE